MTNLESSTNLIHLLKLPSEIIIGICYFLEPNETILLSLTCNSAYLIIHNNPIIWRFYCHKFGFVQFKKDKLWCSDYSNNLNYENKIDNNNVIDILNNSSNHKNKLKKKYTLVPKEEVEAYSIEFGSDNNFLTILEYNWWNKNINISNKNNIIKGKKPFNNWSNINIDNIKLDISLATELVNWRLVFYMNILNKDSNNTFWLRIGNHIDLMTPITSVKIDPKIYKNVDENISIISNLAKKIKYLSTLHTCRHFIRLPCPMRIRELLIGERVGSIITSEPNSQGRYILELPKELVHLFDDVKEIHSEVNYKSNKLQLPINIYKKKSFNECQIKISNISQNYNNLENIETDHDKNLYKVNSSSIQFVTIANAFLSYSTNPNWKTSLTPRSIPAFKKINSSNSINSKLFIEILEEIHKNQVNKTKNIEFDYYKDLYSNTYKTHSPINCTTPCSAINRTFNLEFQNIKQYFQMLCSNSIIFNMFATSITLQDSYIDSENIHSCWCEYPKSLLGCIWHYSPTKSNIQDIKEISKIMSSYIQDSNQKFIFNNFFGSKETIEINLRIDYLMESKNYQINQKFINIIKHITFKRNNSCLGDLLISIIENLNEIFKEEFYPVIILSGLGWRYINEYNDQNNDLINNDQNIEYNNNILIKRIYGDKYIKNDESINKLKYYIFDLLANLIENLSFVNGELIYILVKDVDIENINEDIKEQFQINKDFIIPVSWSNDNQSISHLGFLPYKEYNYNIDNKQQIYIQNNLSLKMRFSKCKLIIISREKNRFDIQQELTRLNKDIQKLNINNIINNTNDFYKDFVNERVISNYKFKNLNSISTFNTISFQEKKSIIELESKNRIFNDNNKEIKVTILNSTEDTRQFEFHNDRSDLILIGTSFGKVKIIDRYRDLVLGEEGISISPIIGLCWFNQHPELFVSGSCLIGSISILSIKENPFFIFDLENDIEENNNKEKILQNSLPFNINIENQSKSFPQLSSVSVNPTDDFFLTSGFGKSVALYSTYTGSQIKIMPSMHMSHINIVRFSNFHPHIFSTVSFDSSCKLWDLRQKIGGNDHIYKFELPCMAIMSSFSPQDDQKILISGVDNYVKEVDLRYKESCKKNLDIPRLNDDHSFRRSVYNSNGRYIFTINTRDKYIKVFDSINYCLKYNFNFNKLTNNLISNNNLDFNNEFKIHTFKNDVLNESYLNINNELFNEEINTQEFTIRNKDYYLQSVRGHPIFTDIAGTLLLTNGCNKSKVSLIKF